MRDYWTQCRKWCGLDSGVSVVGFLDEGLLGHVRLPLGEYREVSVVGFLDEGLLATSIPVSAAIDSFQWLDF